jgi:hypothetical protein
MRAGKLCRGRDGTGMVSQQRRAALSGRRQILCSYAENVANTGSPMTQELDEEKRDKDIMERRQLLQRQLAVAVSEEDYVQAAAFRDELFTLKESLSPLGNYLLSQADKMKERERTREERMKAAEALARLGDQR